MKKKNFTYICEDDTLDYERINEYMKLSPEEIDKAIKEKEKRWALLTEEEKKKNVLMHKLSTHKRGCFCIGGYYEQCRRWGTSGCDSCHCRNRRREPRSHSNNNIR